MRLTASEVDQKLTKRTPEQGKRKSVDLLETQ